MRKAGKGFIPVFILLIIFSTGIFASEIIFYTLPQEPTTRHLTQYLEWRTPAAQWQNLNGRWHLIHPKTGAVVGEVSLPFSYSGGKFFIIRKLFDLTDIGNSAIFLNFERINGEAEIKINNKILYAGSRNFLPLRLQIPTRFLQTGPNTIHISMKPYSEFSGQIPGWLPVNQPRIDSGIPGSVYLEILPLLHIESVKTRAFSENSLVTIKGTVALSYPLSTYEHTGISISYFSGEERIFQERIPVADSSQRVVEIPEWKGEDLLPWDLNNNHHYWVEVVLDSNGVALHTLRQEIALRSVATGNNRFYLNGQLRVIKGVNYVYQNPDGHLLFDAELARKDLRWIKAQGFNAIRSVLFPMPESFYRICDEEGLLCFQDLPINFFNGPEGPDSAMFAVWQQYYTQIGRLASRFPSIAAVGLVFQMDGISKKQRSQLKKFMDTLQKIPLPHYISTPDPAPELSGLVDFSLVDVLDRNKLMWQLKEIEKMYSNKMYFPSGFSKAISYRVDSTTVIHDLSQIANLLTMVNTELEEGKLFGHFVPTYSDFCLEFPSLQNQAHGDPYLNKVGLVNLAREPRPLFNIYGDSLNTALPLNSQMVPRVKNVRSYYYIILGFLNLFLFLFFYRQFIEFRQNINYSLKKTHGFFINLQERIQIPNGQSFLLFFVTSLNGAIMWSSMAYYFRNNLFLDYLLSLFAFSPELKQLASELIWDQLFFLLMGTLYGFVVFLFFAILLKIFSLFGKTRVQFRQAIAVSAWSAVPFVLLIPVGIIFYNILITFKSYWIMLALLLYFHVWFYLRWINGTRVLTDRLYSRVFMFFTALGLVCGAAVLIYYQYKINIMEHLQFVIHLYSMNP